jgi:hypothetical protein
MKITVNVDCTPEEARAFLGLPDVGALNNALVEEMTTRMKDNMSAMEPEVLMRSWMSFGGEWQKQIMDLVGQSVASGTKKP